MTPEVVKEFLSRSFRAGAVQTPYPNYKPNGSLDLRRNRNRKPRISIVTGIEGFDIAVEKSAVSQCGWNLVAKSDRLCKSGAA